jgi:hypothetical protein
LCSSSDSDGKGEGNSNNGNSGGDGSNGGEDNGGDSSGNSSDGEKIGMIQMHDSKWWKTESEFIPIPLVDLPIGAMEDCDCPFGDFAQTTCCACVTTAAAATTTTALTCHWPWLSAIA